MDQLHIPIQLHFQVMQVLQVLLQERILMMLIVKTCKNTLIASQPNANYTLVLTSLLSPFPDGYCTTFKNQHDWFNQGTHIQILPNKAKGFKVPPGFRFSTQNPTFCKFTWDGDQWDDKAKHFQAFMIQLKYKAESVHIGYLTNAEMQPKLMYFDNYAFTDDCFNKTGDMSPQQVIQDD